VRSGDEPMPDGDWSIATGDRRTLTAASSAERTPHRGNVPDDRRTLTAANSAERTPHGGDVPRRRLAPLVQRAEDQPADVVVPGDAVRVHQHELDRRVDQGLAWIHVEEERLVEDRHRRGDHAASGGSRLLATHPPALVHHVHLDA